MPCAGKLQTLENRLLLRCTDEPLPVCQQCQQLPHPNLRLLQQLCQVDARQCCP